MHLNCLVFLSLVAFSAATITGTRNIFVDEDGNYIVMVNQDGRTVQMVFDKEGQKATKTVAIQVAGPMVMTKSVNFSDDKVKGSEKHQTDLVKELLQQYHGSVDIAKFQTLLKTIEKHVQNGELHPNYLHAMEFIHAEDVEDLEGKNPLVKLFKESALPGKGRDIMGMYGTKTPFEKYGRPEVPMPYGYGMDEMMPYGHKMRDYMLQKERQNLMEKLAMQKYKYMLEPRMMDEIEMQKQAEREQIMRMLAEQQMKNKYDVYKRMMLGQAGMEPEIMTMGQEYDRYMQPGSWYTGKYGMMDKTYDMGKYDIEDTQATMLRKILYGAPQRQGVMYSQRSGMTSPMTQRILKKQMYQSQLPVEDDVSLEEMMMQQPRKMWGTKQAGAKDTEYELREKMMRMYPSLMKMRPTTYEGDMMMEESPMMEKTRYEYPRQSYSSVMY